jgi:hypothetical protein
MQGNPGEFLAGDFKHSPIQVYALDLELVPEPQEVRAGPAGYIKQSVAHRAAMLAYQG